MNDITTKRPISRLQRYFSSERPGLAAVIFGFVTLMTILGMLELSDPGESALQAVRPTSGIVRWAALGILTLLWPLSTVVTHAVAKSRGFHASFLKELHIIGKAWILHILTLIVIDIVVIALVSIGWTTLAEFWYISVRGGLLWVVFYPAAIESIYGPEVRSCLITFLTVLTLSLLVVASALISRILP